MANKLNLNIDQGADFSTTINVTNINGMPIDLTTYTARMQVREKYTSPSAVVNITTENGGITLGGEEGTIDLDINATATSNLVAKEYVYDLELVSSSVVTRLIEGKFIVTPEVTK